MKSKSNALPIGVMDSGFGGLSILQEIMRLLPRERCIYFGDNKNCPYGNRTQEEIKELTFRITRYLLDRRCKLIVLACNTMTTTVIEDLRKAFRVPFVGIEPAIKVAARLTKTKNIGVLATKGTFVGEKYLKTKETIKNDVVIHTQIGTGLVEMVESGAITGIRLRNTLYNYLDAFMRSKVDQIVLGCTHYPFLIDYMKAYLGSTAGIINPAPAVARQVKVKCEELRLLNTGRKKPDYQLITSHGSFPITRFIPSINRYDYSILTDVTI